MAVNKGKKFEQCVLNSFKYSFPKGTIDRIYDTEGRKKGIRNICDYIGFSTPHIYYLEAKSLKGNTFNLKKLTQYGKLAEKMGIEDACAGVVIWFIEHQKVVFASIEKVTELMKNEIKSINIRYPNTYTMELPTVIKRVYPEINFSVLQNIFDKTCV